MDSDLQRPPAPIEDLHDSSAAFSGNATPMDDPALRFRTHWSRILHHDLFAPARRGNGDEADDSANED